MFLEVKNLNVELGDFKLKNINLSVNKGEYLILIGPTGSGKSVLLETIIGFYKQKTGHIILNNQEIDDVLPENRNIGIVYQDHVLFPNMNVYENIAYGLKKNEKLSKEKIDKKINEMAKIMEIDHILDRNIKTLSGGESQRTALARTLIVEPEIVLMDEPFSALDISTQKKLTTLIKEIGHKQNTTFIHVTHNFNDVWNLADKVGVMRKGKLHQLGSVFEIFSKPENSFVADFVGIQNIFEGILEKKENNIKIELENGIEIFSNDLETAKNLKNHEKVLVAIRPENIIFSNVDIESSARNRLKGKIVNIKFSGPTVNIETEVNGVIFKGMLTKNSFENLEIELEKEIYLIFKSINVNIIDNYANFNEE